MAKFLASNHDYIIRYHAARDAKILQPDHAVQQVNNPLFIDDNFNVLVWNIFKQKRVTSIPFLENYAMNSALILLQEAQTTPILLDFIQTHQKIADQVPAYSLNDIYAGVMTISNVVPLYSRAFKAREPLIRIPKSALITQYQLPNEQKLLVVNIHSVNFSLGIKIYHQQIQIIVEQVRNHKGPVILAGDFNAWNRKRLSILYQLIRQMNLKPVKFTNDIRKTFLGKPLDFIFYRNLNVTQSEIIHTQSSDHNPLFVNFKI